MKVLITGGAGFIGSHLTDKLLERGDHVLVVDNYQTGRRDNLCPEKNLEIVEGTVADTALMEGLFHRFQPAVVVHAAAAYKDPDNWLEDLYTNGVGTVNVVKGCQKHGVKRLVYFQTALCYGIKPTQQPVQLDHPHWPDSSYAISKTTGENYLVISGLSWVSFRLANVYGPRNISGPLPTFYSRLTTGKPCFVMDTRRDFVYIDDLIAVVMKAVDGMGQGVYHVSSGSDVAIKDLFDATIKALGIHLDDPVEVRPRGEDDAPTILLDPARTNQDFGWKAVAGLEDGVRQAIEYYKAHGVTETYTHLKQPEPVSTK
ncbi:MAG: NAD-dependent epimerase/dehydratase family protein [Candidatus Eremiobacterota bacterium]